MLLAREREGQHHVEDQSCSEPERRCRDDSAQALERRRCAGGICCPGAGHLAAEDTKSVLHLTMDNDWEVEACFNCGGGMESMLPVILGMLGLFVWVRRRW